MSRSVFSVLSGFLSKHVGDLQAVDVALSGILHALPVNAETRSTIQEAIDRVRDSAVNIENAVTAFGSSVGGGEKVPEGVTIKRSDIDKAVADAMPGAIAAYFHDHPATPTAPDTSVNTGLNRSAPAPTADASEETRDSQAGDTGSGNRADAGAFAGDAAAVGEERA